MGYHTTPKEKNLYHSNLLVLVLHDHQPSRQETFRRYLLKTHIICNSEFYLIFYFLNHLIENNILNIICCCVVLCILSPFEEPIQLLSLSPDVHPYLHVIQFLWKSLNPANVDLTLPRDFWIIYLPHLWVSYQITTINWGLHTWEPHKMFPHNYD